MCGRKGDKAWLDIHEFNAFNVIFKGCTWQIDEEVLEQLPECTWAGQSGQLQNTSLPPRLKGSELLGLSQITQLTACRHICHTVTVHRGGCHAVTLHTGACNPVTIGGSHTVTLQEDLPSMLVGMPSSVCRRSCTSL